MSESSQTGHLGQNQGDRRDVGDQQQTCNDGHIVHEHIGHDLFQRGAAHLDADEQRIADGRGDVADAQVVHQDHTELDGQRPRHRGSAGRP